MARTLFMPWRLITWFPLELEVSSVARDFSDPFCVLSELVSVLSCRRDLPSIAVLTKLLNSSLVAAPRMDAFERLGPSGLLGSSAPSG